jgi:hypothetical protein
MADQPLFDMSKAQPVAGPAATPASAQGAPLFDMSKAQPVQGARPQGTSYQATPEESTPEGHAAAVAQREKDNPTLTAIGKGSGEALGDIWDSVKGMVSHPVDTAGGAVGAGAGLYEHIKESIPILHSYEQARSQGKGVLESLSAANDKAKEISQARDGIKQRVDEFKKQPGIASVRALGDAATMAATIWDGGELNPANLASDAAEAAPVAAETPAAATTSEAAAPAKPGVVQQAKSLLFPDEAAAEQGHKDMIKTALGGGSKADADVS